MKKALIIGSAPCLLDQISKIKPDDYSILVCINNCFNDYTKKIFDQNKIFCNYYFFSNYLYKKEKKTIDCIKIKNKIVYVLSHEKNSFFEKDIKICPSSVFYFAMKIGEFPNHMWPSTGMVALSYFFLEENVDHVDLAGFSFFEGKLHYYNDDKLDTYHHSTNFEKKIFEYFKLKYKCSLIS